MYMAQNAVVVMIRNVCMSVVRWIGELRRMAHLIYLRRVPIVDNRTR